MKRAYKQGMLRAKEKVDVTGSTGQDGRSRKRMNQVYSLPVPYQFPHHRLTIANRLLEAPTGIL